MNQSNSQTKETILKLKPFSLEMLNPSTKRAFQAGRNFSAGCKCVVIGKANTGKSTLIKSIMYAKKHIFPVALVMSGSENTNHFYETFVPKTFIHNEYDEEVIEKFVKRQKIAMEHLPNPWAILLIDDCTDEPKVFRRPLQNNLYKVGRHYAMLYILSLQYAIDIRPSIRVNVDVCFILREPSIKIRKSIWENYASIIPDFAMFCDIMDQLDEYMALVIKNDSTSNKMEDCVFYYKAPIVPKDFKFGSKEYWQFHNDRFNPEFKDSY
jgi:hypothetical protein